MGREQKGPIRASFVSSKIFRILWVSDFQIIIIQSSLSFSLKFQVLSQRHIYAEQTTKLSSKQRMRNGGLQFVTKLSGWFEGDFYTIFHCVCQDIREESRKRPRDIQAWSPLTATGDSSSQGANELQHFTWIQWSGWNHWISTIQCWLKPANELQHFTWIQWFWMKISNLSIFHLSWHKYSRVFAAYRLF